MLIIGICGGFFSRKFRNSFIGILYVTNREGRILARELGISYSDNKADITELIGVVAANTTGQKNEVIRGKISHLLLSNPVAEDISAEEKDDRINAAYSLMQTKSKADRKELATSARYSLNPVTTWAWNIADILLVGYVVKGFAKFIGFVATRASGIKSESKGKQGILRTLSVIGDILLIGFLIPRTNADSNNSVTRAMDKFVNGGFSWSNF